ncbi:uncharacterized protein LOC110731908 [Chenopodium quinoa]|uniref:uncharacterized protein LOC110731908 n=1 Tax=Chenopodium quinoa TaxID=63459 RepID=UPI000B77FD01|nr:uncharacterized protein LOC110731908 [Chenopodium quinoa]
MGGREVSINLGEDNENGSLLLLNDEDGEGDDADDTYNPDDYMEPETDDESVEEEEIFEKDDDVPKIEDSYDPFEDLDFECENDEDNYLTRLYNNGEVYKDEGFGKIVLKEWQLFTDKQHLRDVVRDYCIQYGITWAIKTIHNPEHTCQGLDSRNNMVNVRWAKRMLLEDIRANNDIPAKSLNDLLFQRYGVQMALSTLYRVRTQALIDIHGGHDVSYKDLPTYCDVLKELNPGSVSYCAWRKPSPERPIQFSSNFICFKACLDGLTAGCRSLIGVDGAHLKGNYGGVLLFAVALDGNNEIFPIAWAIVGKEDSDS